LLPYRASDQAERRNFFRESVPAFLFFRGPGAFDFLRLAAAVDGFWVMNPTEMIEQFRSEDKCRDTLKIFAGRTRLPLPGAAAPHPFFCCSIPRQQWECNEDSCRYQYR